MVVGGFCDLQTEVIAFPRSQSLYKLSINIKLDIYCRDCFLEIRTSFYFLHFSHLILPLPGLKKIICCIYFITIFVSEINMINIELLI